MSKTQTAKTSTAIATATATQAPGVDAPAIAIPAVTFLALPLRFLSGALTVASKDAARPYLGGVHICRKADTIRIEATDGHRAFIWQSRPQAKADLPAWLDAAGMILGAEGLAPRLAILRNAVPKADRESALVKIGFAKGAVFATVTTTGRDTFACDLVDGQFPEIDRVIPENAFTDREFEAGTATAYSAKYLKEAGAMAAIIGAAGMHLFAPADNGPTVATFPGQDGALLVLMPLRDQGLAITADTAAAIPQAVKGTLAALRAHATRTEEAMAAPDFDKAQTDSMKARLAGFRERIAAIMSGTAPALPAPDAKAAKLEAAKAARAAKLEAAKLAKAKAAEAKLAQKAAKANAADAMRRAKAPKRPRVLGPNAAPMPAETVN